MAEEKTKSPELVVVFETPEEAEALVVHGLLEAEGIESLVTSLYAQQEILPGVGGVVVRVAPERADQARRVIEEFRANPDAEAESEAEATVEPAAPPSPTPHPEKS